MFQGSTPTETNGHTAPVDFGSPAAVMVAPTANGHRRQAGAQAGPDITLMLQQAELGDERAIDELLPAVYEELRDLAARFLKGERREHTLQPTALVHEAYIRLVGAPQIRWENRAHFFATAATIIRRILLKHARTKKCAKRGGGWRRVPLDLDVTVKTPDIDIVALDEALGRLGRFAPQELRVVELRFFAGLSVEGTADVLGVSPRTVARDWRIAKAWLSRELQGADADES
jgi:RNA polymerase sigma factor (TIGR02999 family)